MTFFLAPRQTLRKVLYLFLELRQVGELFLGKCVSCFIEIPYQVKRRRHLQKQIKERIGTSRPLALRKIETPKQLLKKIETARRT